MSKIRITCQTCHETHEVTRTNEIPKHVISMGCNWCPCCVDKAEGNYEEWYNESDGNNENAPEPVPDNQLMLFTEFDDLINKADALSNIVIAIDEMNINL